MILPVPPIQLAWRLVITRMMQFLEWALMLMSPRLKLQFIQTPFFLFEIAYYLVAKLQPIAGHAGMALKPSWVLSIVSQIFLMYLMAFHLPKVHLTVLMDPLIYQAQ